MWVTGIAEHEITPKLAVENVNKMSDLFHEKISLSVYGTTIKELIFIFIAVEPTDKIHEEETTYLKEEKKLLLYRKLPYDKVKSYSTEEVLRLMAETYLKSITALDDLDLPDFDHHRLAKDVERLFVNLGWIVKKTGQAIPHDIQQEAVISFLKSKDWEEKSRSSRYLVLSPPKDQPTLKDMQLYVPMLGNEQAVAAYKRDLSAVVEAIVRVYEVDSLELLVD